MLLCWHSCRSVFKGRAAVGSRTPFAGTAVTEDDPANVSILCIACQFYVRLGVLVGVRLSSRMYVALPAKASLTASPYLALGWIRIGARFQFAFFWCCRWEALTSQEGRGCGEGQEAGGQASNANPGGGETRPLPCRCRCLLFSGDGYIFVMFRWAALSCRFAVRQLRGRYVRSA